MQKFCYSCAAPLEVAEFKGPAENLCKYCADEQGNLKDKDNVQNSIADWFQEWQPDLDRDTAIQRASYYMKSMPAWAGD